MFNNRLNKLPKSVLQQFVMWRTTVNAHAGALGQGKNSLTNSILQPKFKSKQPYTQTTFFVTKKRTNHPSTTFSTHSSPCTLHSPCRSTGCKTLQAVNNKDFPSNQ